MDTMEQKGQHEVANPNSYSTVPRRDAEAVTFLAGNTDKKSRIE